MRHDIVDSRTDKREVDWNWKKKCERNERGKREEIVDKSTHQCGKVQTKVKLRQARGKTTKQG